VEYGRPSRDNRAVLGQSTGSAGRDARPEIAKGITVNRMVKAADDLDAHIGGRVRLRRMMIGMSQEQLGEALGLTFQQVQKYEKGLNRIGAGRLYRMAQIMRVPIEFFFEGLPEIIEPEDEPERAAQKAEIMGFLSTPEGYALSTAFANIDDSATRRRLVDLIRTIAGADST